MDITQQFINKSKLKFKDLYDYSNVVYINSKTEINLRCIKHDLKFRTKASSHLKTSLGGCTECLKDFKQRISDKYKSSTEEFIEKANIVHNNIYDYSKFEYKLARDKSTVFCDIHGEFEISPNNHLAGKGCPPCGDIKTGKLKIKSASEKFTNQANNIHSNRYTYENFQYQTAKTKSLVTCDTHGDFLCSPDNHLRGKGCPACAKSNSGWTTLESFQRSCKNNLKGNGILYMLEFTDLRTNQKFFKVGVTSKSIHARYPKTTYKDYTYKIIFSIVSDAKSIFYTEQLIHNTYCEYKEQVSKDFAGYSECYILDPTLIDKIKDTVRI